MALHSNHGARAPRLNAPTKDKADAANVGRVGGHKSGENPDCLAPRMAEQAAEVIEGEHYARAWLARLQAGTAQPGELAVIVAFLSGEMLHGACRLIEMTLEGRRHA